MMMQAGERDYVLLRPVRPELRAQGKLRRVSAFVAGAALLSALLVVALFTSQRPVARAESSVSADLNDKFLQANAAGDAGKDFLSRLQDIWFVESNGGREDLAGDATQMAGNLVCLLPFTRKNRRSPGASIGRAGPVSCCHDVRLMIADLSKPAAGCGLS